MSRELTVTAEHAGERLDVFVTREAPTSSRARAQQLIRHGSVQVNGAPAKASLRIARGDRVEISGGLQAAPLRAQPEAIPLDIVYEDDDIAVINKPAGMMVHAGAGMSDAARNRGTLVNALLHHLRNLSRTGGALRPGVVHRLDRMTSGLMVVAKNDAAHQALAAQFAGRRVKKTYIALVHGWPKKDQGTIERAVGRDRVRRTRMSTRTRQGRAAISHFRVLEKLETPWGKLTLLEVRIETGRTHQIRVHMASLNHPVVGDTLYGAPRQLQPIHRQASRRRGKHAAGPTLGRNFLHAAQLELAHPRSGKTIAFTADLPPELRNFLQDLHRSSVSAPLLASSTPAPAKRRRV